MLDLIDLEFLGTRRAISTYLVETDAGLALCDCGPTTALPTLERALSDRGLTVGDIDHLLITHIHLDHAGAAGVIARQNPDIQVWVSEIGARHLVEPGRLEASARRLYGERFDALWGELAPVPVANIRVARDDAVGWEVIPATGHASHHVAYFRDGTVLAGDSCGISPQPADYVLPLSPPPDIDVEAWAATINEIGRRQPKRLALTHFGIVDTPGHHMELLRSQLELWAERVGSGATQEEFIAEMRPQTGADAPVLFDPVDSFGQSWLGLRRYWDKKLQATDALQSGG